MTEVGDTASPVGSSGASGGNYRKRQRSPGRHGDRGYRAVRLRGDLSGGPQPGSQRLLGIRGVLGRIRLVTGAANGLLQETTREVRSLGYLDVSADGRRTHPLRVSGMVGLGSLVVIAGSSPLWSGRVFAEARWLSVALLSIGLAGFCLHATLLGMLAGTNRWTQYGALMVADAVIRVVVAAATFVIGWQLVGFIWATVAGSVAWLIMLMTSPPTRAAARLMTPGATATFLRAPPIRSSRPVPARYW